MMCMHTVLYMICLLKLLSLFFCTGHMNAFRQGRSLGTYLIVGLNSYETIQEAKGRPILSDDVRFEHIILLVTTLVTILFNVII